MTSSRTLFVALAVAILTLGTTLSLRAQDGEDNPLFFQTEFQRIGGEIGLSSVWQQGVYEVGCGRFEEGARINPVIAVAYDRPIGAGFRFEALLGYQSRSLRSTFNSRENVVVSVQSEGRTTTPRVDIDFENIGDASFSYIFLLPSLKFYFTKAFYVGAGANAGLLLGSSTQYTKNILTKTLEVPGYGLAEIYYPEDESSDPYSKVYPEEDRSDASSLGFDAVGYIGAEFPIGRKLKLGPRILYTFPLTPVFNDPELKLNSLQILVGLRYDLN
jgi:hypothetical protein